MSPAFLFLAGALIVIGIWAVWTKLALDRRINKRLEREEGYKKRLADFRAKKATERVEELKDHLDAVRAELNENPQTDETSAKLMTTILGDRPRASFYGGGPATSFDEFVVARGPGAFMRSLLASDLISHGFFEQRPIMIVLPS